MQGHDWHSRTVHMCILAADFYNLHRQDAQYSSHDIPWDWNNRSLTSKHNMFTCMLRGGNSKLQFVYLYTGQRSEWQQVHLQHWQSVLFTAKSFRRYFVFRYKTHIILILSFKSYPIFEHLTSFMEQSFMYFRKHKRIETKVVKGHFATKSFRPWDVSGPRLF